MGCTASFGAGLSEVSIAMLLNMSLSIIMLAHCFDSHAIEYGDESLKLLLNCHIIGSGTSALRLARPMNYRSVRRCIQDCSFVLSKHKLLLSVISPSITFFYKNVHIHFLNFHLIDFANVDLMLWSERGFTIIIFMTQCRFFLSFSYSINMLK